MKEKQNELTYTQAINIALDNCEHLAELLGTERVIEEYEAILPILNQLKKEIEVYSKYKELEGELGVGFDIIIKLFKNGGYLTTSSNDIVRTSEDVLSFEPTILKYYLNQWFAIELDDCCNEWWRKLKDYGKTWALEEGELLNEKINNKE